MYKLGGVPVFIAVLLALRTEVSPVLLVLAQDPVSVLPLAKEKCFREGRKWLTQSTGEALSNVPAL
jgi:hypothetical protein